MKIGVFDSGLGGLIITRGLISALPQYDYYYLGDTDRVPYGDRSQAEVYEYTRQGVDYLLRHDCGLVIIACNTSSSEALRRIQREYLPGLWGDRRVLGVLVPAAEAAADATATGRIGVLATTGTITSGAFNRELLKLRSDLLIKTQAAPLLVPLVENNDISLADSLIASYLSTMTGIDTLILGCTHYALLKQSFRKAVGPAISVISQDEVLPAKLTDYLTRHPDLEITLSRDGSRRYEVTHLTPGSISLAKELYSEPVRLDLVTIT